MASNEEDNPVELKVEEVGVLQQKEQNEEEEEEEVEPEEENDQKPQNQNPNNQENNDEEEGEEEGKMEIKLVKEKEDDQIDDDENKQSFDIDLEPELKVTVEWYITGNNDVDILFKTMSKQKLWLHWGVSQGNDGKNWSRIEKSYYPALTYEFQETSLQTEFSYLEQSTQRYPGIVSITPAQTHLFGAAFFSK